MTGRHAIYHALLMAIACVPFVLVAQRQEARRAGVVRMELSDGVRSETGIVRFGALPPNDTGSYLARALGRIPLSAAPLASAILPGAGQARLGQDRFVGYLAVEAYLLVQYFKNSHEGNTNAETYRALARDVARRSFPGTHPDTVWGYYELMESFLESGAFTIGFSGTTVPETDTTTYNGRQWMLARQTFGIALDDPAPTASAGYVRALAFYESRAVPQAYGWSWRNAQLEKDLYVRVIGRANDAYRRATNDLIVLIANHVLSTIDAFATLRLLQASQGGLRVGATVGIP